jgi:acetyl-CoA carboxylase biotin carboxyl carrier protein
LDLKQVKQIIDLMKRSDLTEFEIEEEGFKIKIKRSLGEQPVSSGSSAPLSGGSGAYPANNSPGESSAQNSAQATPVSPSSGGVVDESGYSYVKSPMVGTFYRSPSPDSPAFAGVDTKVEANTVVCIIEAMKIMNEIQAETKGTVVEVLVENGQPVEYGQRLFKVKLA